MNYITTLLSNTGFIMYNKTVAKNCGVNEAIILGEICAKYQYWLDAGKLTENDEWFYLTRDDIENDTGLTSHQQRTAMLFWIANAVLETKRKGMPAKTHYYLNIENLNILLCNYFTTSSAIISQHDVQKLNATKKENKKENKKDISTATEYKEKDLESESLQKCLQHYSENIGTIVPITKESIEDCLNKGADQDLICVAIDESVKHNKRSWAYIEKIILRCLKAGIKTAKAFNSEPKPKPNNRYARSDGIYHNATSRPEKSKTTSDFMRKSLNQRMCKTYKEALA